MSGKTADKPIPTSISQHAHWIWLLAVGKISHFSVRRAGVRLRRFLPLSRTGHAPVRQRVSQTPAPDSAQFASRRCQRGDAMTLPIAHSSPFDVFPCKETAMTVLTALPATARSSVDHLPISVSPEKPQLRLRPEAPLTGRESLMSDVRTLLDEQHWRGLMFAGQQGTGKTRLLQEVENEARKAGWRTLWIQPHRSVAARPLVALTQAMASAGLGSPSSFSEAASLLGRALVQRPLFMLVDDIHLLDRVSLGVLMQVSCSKESILACTFTQGRAGDGEISALLQAGTVHRFAVSPLEDHHLAAICTSLLSQPLAYPTALIFARLADGRVTVLRELLTGAVEEQVLQQQDGVWSCGGRLPFRRLAEMVPPRLDGIDTAHRTALELVSLAGTLPLPVAIALSPARVWEGLESAGLIRTTAATGSLMVQPATRLLPKALTVTLPALRRRRLLQTLLEVPTGTGVFQESDPVRFVLWQRELGVQLPEEQLLDAARHAWWSDQGSTAQLLAHRAWSVSQSNDAALVLTHVLFAQGNHRQALRITRTMSAKEHRRPGRYAQQQPTHRIGPEPAADAVKAARLLCGGSCAAAWRLVKPVVLFDEDPVKVITAGSVGLAALLHMGQPQSCLKLEPRLDDMITRLRESGDVVCDISSIRVLLAYARGAAGERTAAVAQLRSLLLRGAQRGNHLLAERAGIMLGLLLFEDGSVSEAHRFFASVPAHTSTDSFHSLACAGAVITATHLADGIALRRAVDAMQTAGHRRGHEAQIAFAVHEHQQGATDAATSRLTKATNAAVAAGAFGTAAKMVHLLARMDRATLGAKLCGTWTGQVGGTIDALGLAFTQAAATGQVDQVQACAEAFESTGAVLYAAEGWAVCSRLYRKAGQPRHATAASQRCTAARAGYDGRPPVLLHVVEDSEPLTRREREVALLAASGHTDQVIAQRLVLSVRTVSNHLYSIYRKLGVPNRRALQGYFDHY